MSIGSTLRPDKGKVVWLVIGIAAAGYLGLSRFLPKIHKG